MRIVARRQAELADDLEKDVGRPCQRIFVPHEAYPSRILGKLVQCDGQEDSPEPCGGNVSPMILPKQFVEWSTEPISITVHELRLIEQVLKPRNRDAV
ncbi:MAG: hypothetical protein ACO3NL_13805, partial [Phycisphaerales bacterium]